MMGMKSRGLMIIHNFRPGIVGGAELQAERLAIQLVKMGHDMQVLTRRTGPEALPEETIQGVRVHRVDFRLPYWITFDNAQTFRYLLRNHHSFDILHAHMAFGHAVVAVVFARCFAKKCILKIACAGEYGDLHNFSRFAGFDRALRILHQADAIVAVSSEVKEELIGFGFPTDRIIRIPNGVDTTFFQRRVPPPAGGKTRFILIGRRHPQKGVDILLHAARLLHEKGYGDRYEVSLYGADYPEYDYRAIAHEMGVADAIHFFPFEKDILALYNSVHCFLLPSRGEGLSNALLEAMAMELPVIATPVSGTPDVVEDGKDGILIPPDSPERLAESMIGIIENPERRRDLGRNARRKIEEHFSLESVARQYSELYGYLLR